MLNSLHLAALVAYGLLAASGAGASVEGTATYRDWSAGTARDSSGLITHCVAMTHLAVGGFEDENAALSVIVAPRAGGQITDSKNSTREAEPIERLIFLDSVAQSWHAARGMDHSSSASWPIRFANPKTNITESHIGFGRFDRNSAGRYRIVLDFDRLLEGAMRRGDRMSIVIRDRDQMVWSLSGSSAALDQLDRCAGQLISQIEAQRDGADKR